MLSFSVLKLYILYLIALKLYFLNQSFYDIDFSLLNLNSNKEY